VTSRIRQLAIVAALGVIISVALIVFGLPESTDSQRLALELSALPLSLALAAGDLILLERAERLPSPPARIALIAGAVTSAVGLGLMALAYSTGPRGMVQFGQFVVFVGLLVVLLIGINLQAPSQSPWFHLDEEAESEESDPDQADEAADPTPDTSL
jgi:hypothetical protein